MIYSYGANDEVDDFVEDENSDDTDGLSVSDRDFLEAAINDYNLMFHTNYDTLNLRSIYNQVANYAYLDTPINILIGDRDPNDYFTEAFESAENIGMVFGNPMTLEKLKSNLESNCIPLEIKDCDYNNYLDGFLPARRKLMAQKIKKYYKNL